MNNKQLNTLNQAYEDTDFTKITYVSFDKALGKVLGYSPHTIQQYRSEIGLVKWSCKPLVKLTFWNKLINWSKSCLNIKS